MWWLAHGEHEVPASADWLSPREQAMLAALRYTKRRVEFLTRRWTAKRAVATVLDRDLSAAALAAVEIRHHLSGAPYLEVDGRPAAIDVSLSDRAGWAVCLVGRRRRPRPARHRPGARGAAQRGIRRRLPHRRRERLRAQPAAGAARDEAANLIWSAKEAALKVRKVGLRADTRRSRSTWARSATPMAGAPCR